MILYATKQTFESYGLNLPANATSPLNMVMQEVIDKEAGDEILEWGAKLFYFDGRRCIQISHFASKLTLFLFDIKVENLVAIGDFIAHHLKQLYKNDQEMTKALDKMFKMHPTVCFDKLTNRSMASILNANQSQCGENNCYFAQYIRNGVLHSLEINHEFNFIRPARMKIEGKIQWLLSGEKFREVMLERFGEL